MAPTTNLTTRPRPSSKQPGGPGPGGLPPLLKAVSHNVGGSASLKINDLLVRFKPDVLALQENVMKTNELKDVVRKQGYEVEANFDESGRPGTALLWKATLPVLEPPQAIEPRTIQLLKIRDEKTGKT